MMAARTGNPETLLLLIERGANVNAAENLRGTTPLMWAAAYEHPAAVNVLLEHGAEVERALEGRSRAAGARTSRRPCRAASTSS